MTTVNNGGPAFPVPLNPGQSWNEMGPCDGMTLRQYAAIKLRIPASGTDWLDQMIEASLRDEMAAKAMPGLMVRNWSAFKGSDSELIEVWARSSYGVADAMLKAREA